MFNVIKKVMLKPKDFTIKNEPIFNAEKMDYLCYGREICPQTNCAHFQGFICFKVRQRYSSVHEIIPGAHIEQTRGNVGENIEYYSKDNTFTEFGV